MTPETHEQDLPEVYCVICKAKVTPLQASAVWTSKGQAALRGVCPICGTTVFRLGRTLLHKGMKAPQAVQVIPAGIKGRAARAAYIISAVTEAELAQKLGADLRQIGHYVWVDHSEQLDATPWSGGVHPALEQCTHLVLVFSAFAAKTESVIHAWEYFRNQRKPIVLALAEAIEPPDALRSRPRFDFTADYKNALRNLAETLMK